MSENSGPRYAVDSDGVPYCVSDAIFLGVTAPELRQILRVINAGDARAAWSRMPRVRKGADLHWAVHARGRRSFSGTLDGQQVCVGLGALHTAPMTFAQRWLELRRAVAERNSDKALETLTSSCDEVLAALERAPELAPGAEQHEGVRSESSSPALESL